MKKYQIFISSTYEDLKKERDQVSKSILEMGHIPIGMEMFNASNKDQWNLIKKRIEESDYYVVIVAQRYGSVHKSGVSFTEMEYDYALEKKIPILGFMLDNTAPWPSEYGEADQARRDSLANFKSKVSKKTIKYWRDESDLAKKVTIALIHEVNEVPRIGWVKSNEVSDRERDEREEKVGLLGIYPQKDGNKKHQEKLEQKLRDAKEVKVFFTTGRGFLGAYKDALGHAISQNDAKIRVLLAEKGSQFLTDVSDMEKTAKVRPDSDDIHAEVDMILATSISEIRNKLNPAQMKNIEIKYYETEFRMSMVLIKDKKDNEWGWITLTFPPAKAVQTVSMEIVHTESTPDSIYQQCEAHFNAVWNKIKDSK